VGQKSPARGSRLQRGRGLSRAAVGLIAVALAACGTPASAPPPVHTKPARAPAPVVTAEPDAAPPQDATSEPAPDKRWGPPENPPPGATTTASGLVYEILEASDGQGKTPDPDDEVDIEYTEWGAADGEQLDSDQTRVVLSTLDAGFREALALMRPGQRARFWVPAALTVRPIAVIRDIELSGVYVIPKPPPDVDRPPRDARRLGKGLRYKILARGQGPRGATGGDRVTVHYSGWTTDGKMFDSSVSRGQPATFSPNQVIQGWTMVLAKMRVGDRWRVWIPEKLAYQGRPGVPQGMLVFDLEVLKIDKAPAPPKTPRHVRRPPRDAKKTASGLRYKLIGPRKPGGARPDASSTVEVHYSGWTTDGKMFDSSITRGKAARFPLTAVIEGWREGILLMRVGERLRMWIPEELAYQGKPGRPAGMLVFDVELLGVE
jgi:peptidylprolyl isomerase